MLRKIKLHGELAKFIGHDEFEAVAHTSAEAIRFLVCNFPDVEAYMSDKYYKVLVKDEAITSNKSPILRPCSAEMKIGSPNPRL